MDRVSQLAGELVEDLLVLLQLGLLGQVDQAVLVVLLQALMHRSSAQQDHGLCELIQVHTPN